MRDDIHKSAPVNTGWRGFMGKCGREADRESRALESARKALEADSKKEISPTFLGKIRAGLSDPQKKLFVESLAESCASGTVAREGQVLEHSIVAHLRRREACGEQGQAAVLGAMSDALITRKESQLRAMTGHWMKKGGASAAPAVTAAKKALDSLSCKELASKILAGESTHSTRSRKTAVDLDENLATEGNS